jgi:hypothetical protein
VALDGRDLFGVAKPLHIYFGDVKASSVKSRSSRPREAAASEARVVEFRSRCSVAISSAPRSRCEVCLLAEALRVWWAVAIYPASRSLLPSMLRKEGSRSLRRREAVASTRCSLMTS